MKFRNFGKIALLPVQYRVKDIASVILSENSLTCAHVQRMAQKQGGEKKCGDVCTVGFIFWPYLGTHIVNLKTPFLLYCISLYYM